MEVLANCAINVKKGPNEADGPVKAIVLKDSSIKMSGVAIVTPENNVIAKKSKSTAKRSAKRKKLDLETAKGLLSSSGSVSGEFTLSEIQKKRKQEFDLMERDIADLNEEQRKRRRLLRNRTSAQLHRERKKNELTQLKTQVRDLQAKLNAALKEIADLKAKSSTSVGGEQSSAANVLKAVVVSPAANIQNQFETANGVINPASVVVVDKSLNEKATKNVQSVNQE